MRVTKNQLRKIVREVLEEQENIGVKVDVEPENAFGDRDKLRAALMTMYPESQVEIFMSNMDREPKPLNEELTKTDKSDIKSMIKKELSAELEKKLKKELPKAVEAELVKALDKKATKDEIATITKKVMKKVYSDISVHHPYIIDRVRL
jgi:acyl carrier protein